MVQHQFTTARYASKGELHKCVNSYHKLSGLVITIVKPIFEMIYKDVFHTKLFESEHL